MKALGLEVTETEGIANLPSKITSLSEVAQH